MSTGEEIFTVKTGLGAAHGDSISNTSQKIYYPWEPDEWGSPQQKEDWGGWHFPGGIHYQSNLKSGDGNLFCQGANWGGNASLGQRHQKYAIFHGEKSHIGSKTNFGSDSPPRLADSHNQAIGYHTINWKTYKGGNYAQVAYHNYSTSVGCALPVYGLTMDITVCRGVCTVNGNGDNWTQYTGAKESTYDLQINQVHGLWAELPGGTSWKAMSLLPNGDNWGDTKDNTDVANGKYIFYNSQEMDSDNNTQRTLLGSDGQHKDLIDMDKKGGDSTFTLKLLMNPNENPPSGHLFMGFCMGIVFGTEANSSKYKFVIVNNVNVIDKVNADKMRDKPEYHGTNPKKTGLHDVLVPSPVSIDGITGDRVTLYGPRKSW